MIGIARFFLGFSFGLDGSTDDGPLLVILGVGRFFLGFSLVVEEVLGPFSDVLLDGGFLSRLI